MCHLPFPHNTRIERGSADLRSSTVPRKGGFVIVELDNGVKYHLHRASLIRHNEYDKKALSGP